MVHLHGKSSCNCKASGPLVYSHDPDLRDRFKETGITEITSKDVATSITYALEAPWYVNVARVELQPTEQTYGGVNFDPLEGSDG